MSGRLRTGLLALAVAGTASAADHPVAGDRLVLTDPPAPRARAFRFRAARDPAVDPSGDPRSVGATLELAGGSPGDGSSGPISLDPTLWKAVRRGFVWLDPGRTSGLRKVVFRSGRHGGTLAASGGGSAWPYRVTQPQDLVDVRFTVGDDVYCAKFTSFARDRAGRVSARRAAAPADCSPGSNAVCGDGIAQAREECDDGNTIAGDGCTPDCTLESTAALCAGVPTVAGTALRARRVAAGLTHPLHLTAPPLDPNRVFVVEQPGRIRVIENGRLLRAPYLDVSGEVSTGDERGLLSVAFHPDFERNGFLYVNYTRAGDGATVVSRFHADPDANRADPASEHVLFTVAQPFPNHNGGLAAFGPDGALYVGMGDGGGGGDPSGNGQDDSTRLGKLLRVDLASETPAIFAKGLRNPWRFSFDRGTGDLYLADVGQDQREEVDVQAAPLVSGVNYGWNVMEGRLCFAPPSGCDPTGLTLPVLEYCHDQSAPECAAHPTGCSITGGFVYRGCRMPDLRGRYFYGDFCSPFVRSFAGVAGGDAQDVRDHTQELAPAGRRAIDAISSFGEDARGELYVVDYGSESAPDGEVWAIVPGG